LTTFLMVLDISKWYLYTISGSQQKLVPKRGCDLERLHGYAYAF